MRTWLLLAVMTAGPFASQAAAQVARTPAATFGELAAKVTSNETVYVVTDNGRRVFQSTTKGQIVAVSDSTITLMVHGAQREFTSSKTRAVFNRDHRGRHALIGLVVGSAIALIGDRLIVKAIGADQSFRAEDFDLVAFAGVLGLLEGSRGERHDLFRAPAVRFRF